jgi:hypothetical protein
MDEEQDYMDLGFDDDCYYISCSLINMWHRRALKQKKEDIKEKSK